MVATFNTPQSGWFVAGQAEGGFTVDRFGKYDPPWGCDYYYSGDPYAGFWADLECAEAGKARAGGGTRLTITPVEPQPMSDGGAEGVRLEEQQ